MIEDIDSKRPEIDRYKKELEADYNLLLKLNPELPKIEDKLYMSQVIDGAIFGFGPDEIRYFCNPSRDLDAESKMFEDLEKYGVQSGYILAPNTVKMLIDVLKQRK